MPPWPLPFLPETHQIQMLLRRRLRSPPLRLQKLLLQQPLLEAVTMRGPQMRPDLPRRALPSLRGAWGVRVPVREGKARKGVSRSRVSLRGRVQQGVEMREAPVRERVP